MKMNEIYLNELKYVEDRLYDIINLCGEDILNNKLSDAWIILYDYLCENGAYNVNR